MVQNTSEEQTKKKVRLHNSKISPFQPFWDILITWGHGGSIFFERAPAYI
jgi:hypothetical protein